MRGIVRVAQTDINNLSAGLSKLTLSIGVGMLVWLLLSAPAFAHHSDSIYEMDTLVSVSGTVEQFEFQNPHTVIFLDVKGENGKVDQWIAFGSAPAILARAGWNKTMLKAKEQITIAGFQFKDGRKGMLLLTVTRADGTVLPHGEIERNYLQKLKSRQVPGAK